MAKTGWHEKISTGPDGDSLHEVLVRLIDADPEAQAVVRAATEALDRLRAAAGPAADLSDLLAYESAMSDHAAVVERVSFDLGYQLGLAARSDRAEGVADLIRRVILTLADAPPRDRLAALVQVLQIFVIAIGDDDVGA